MGSSHTKAVVFVGMLYPALAPARSQQEAATSSACPTQAHQDSRGQGCYTVVFRHVVPYYTVDIMLSALLALVAGLPIVAALPCPPSGFDAVLNLDVNEFFMSGPWYIQFQVGGFVLASSAVPRPKYIPACTT